MVLFTHVYKDCTVCGNESLCICSIVVTLLVWDVDAERLTHLSKHRELINTANIQYMRHPQRAAPEKTA